MPIAKIVYFIQVEKQFCMHYSKKMQKERAPRISAKHPGCIIVYKG